MNNPAPDTARPRAGGAPLPEDMRLILATVVREHGESATLARLDLTRPTLARALGGLGLRRGTVALIRAALAKHGGQP